MGKMDIAERRLPQDGRTTVRIGDGEVDIRMNSVPTNHGERLVLRLLDKTQKVFELEEIGLTTANFELINNFIHYQHGIILVTGPTGSGKTTTLYAGLCKLNSKELNVITIEDPIEYHLGGISQIQVANKKGLTFAAGLRALLRQDPDVMMVGEIRDVETARIAIQSALTGHLVFSTIHTNDAPSSISRLLDIGIEPYLVASSVVCVIAQRLVRLVCPECKAEYEPTDQELTSIGLSRDAFPGDVLWIGMGCSHCIDTGYQGRTAIYEIMPITDEVREQVMNHATSTKIKTTAMANGMTTLRMDGVVKVIEGLTTIEEVMRVTQMDLF
jgi:type II secretory ATPase GspE/PulE/Tfp pilus assembly ATPase PilB-like protein